MSLTYNGSTAGSTLANPPVLLTAGIGGHVQWATSGSTVAPITYGSGAKVWFYASSNAASEVAGAAAIGDGYALGMSLGDIMLGVTTTAGSTSPIFYAGVLVTSGGSTSFCLSSNVITSTAV